MIFDLGDKMRSGHDRIMRGILIAYLAIEFAVSAAQRFESFDRDPDWEGHKNRSVKPQPIHQDFGWSETTHFGGVNGEIGGSINPAAEPAYYAKRITQKTLSNSLSASGTIFVEKGGGHTLLGFFNTQSINEWRTPNTIVLRINQRGDIFHCHLEYCTSRWRAGAGIIGQYDKARDRILAKELPSGRAYSWSIKYDPNGANGSGVITARFGESETTCELSPEHKSDGAEFNRFGVLNVMKQFDNAGRLWLSDLTILSEHEDLSRDPGWDSLGNRKKYDSIIVRPRFDFGFSPTQWAGGKAPGELGGLFFRGDCRYPQRLASYGDRLEMLTLERPLSASGKVTLRRAVTDSTTLIGFYHSTNSLRVNPSQDISTPRDFLGIAIEGPSREGFYFYPVYRNHSDGKSSSMGGNPPRIYPDSASHDWKLDYNPQGGQGKGTITVSLDGKRSSMDVPPGHRAIGAEFDRFGLITPWIDGNGQHVYFDDISYTYRQD